MDILGYKSRHSAAFGVQLRTLVIPIVDVLLLPDISNRMQLLAPREMV